MDFAGGKCTHSSLGGCLLLTRMQFWQAAVTESTPNHYCGTISFQRPFHPCNPQNCRQFLPLKQAGSRSSNSTARCTSTLPSWVSWHAISGAKMLKLLCKVTRPLPTRCSNFLWRQEWIFNGHGRLIIRISTHGDIRMTRLPSRIGPSLSMYVLLIWLLVA